MSTISVLINVLIVVLSVVAWLMVVWGASESAHLAHRGLRSLKYFTVLSNLFSAAVAAAYLAVCFDGLTALPLWLVVLKLVATSDVMLTLITVIVLLIPQYGWHSMYSGGNLWMHLVLPLLAAIDCCLFIPVAKVPYWMTLFALVPLVAYGAFYLSRILIHGAEENDVVYDFYGFLRWGWKWLPIVLAAMLVAVWVIALILRFVGSFQWTGLY